jgi:Uma2 family endonuclease
MMTVAEFLTWDCDDPTAHRWQLIDGEPVAMAPASDNHGSLRANLTGRLWYHLMVPGNRCRVVTEPGIVPRARSDRNFRIPDIGVTRAPPSPGQTLPDPLILIEILAPSNATETWANVWTYLTLPTVMELLVVNSTRIEAELLRRDSDGTWPEVPLRLGPADNPTLDSIGFTVPLAALYQTTTLAMPGGNPP